MLLSSSATLLFGLLNVVAASNSADSHRSDPVPRPREGELVSTGEPFTIRWDSGSRHEQGRMSITLVQGENSDEVANPKIIAKDVEIGAEKYTWDVPSGLESDDNYWLMFKALDAKKDHDFKVIFSHKFSLTGASNGGGDNDSTTGTTATRSVATATAPDTSTMTGPTNTMATTDPSTTTDDAATATTSTETGAAGRALPTPLALLGAAAVGALAL